MSRKKMDIEEFVEFGYLQEVNRRFFHPLGLALAADKPRQYDLVTKKRLPDGEMELCGVWDQRDDLEGILFDKVDVEKAERVTGEMKKRRAARRALPECISKGFTSGLQKVPRG